MPEGSPEVPLGPTDGKLHGTLLGKRSNDQPGEGVLGGTLIEKQRRSAEIASWRSVLVPGAYRLSYDSTERKVIANGDDNHVDVTKLLAPGSPVIRHFPEGHPEGSRTWKTVGVIPPEKEGNPPRIKLERSDGGTMSLRLDQLTGERSMDGKWWEIPIPIE